MLQWDWGKIFAVLSVGLVGVLHATGADKHRTIAGDIARGLGVAAPIATLVHQALASTSAVSAPTAAETP